MIDFFLSIVIVSYRSRALLDQCLDSLAAHPPSTPWEVVVIDNASDDGSVGMVQRRHPNVRLFANGENVGFAQAANQGLTVAKGDLVCFLNSDARVTPGALDALAEVLRRRPRVGIVGPRTVAADGHLIRSCFRFPTLIRPLLDVGPMRWLLPESSTSLAYDGGDASQSREVDWVSGACLMARRDLLDRLGGFDPGFFMYFEDVDLCRRLTLAGSGVLYVGNAVVVHHTRGSTAGVHTPRLFVMEQASRRRYFAKHYGRSGELLVRGFTVAGALWRLTTAQRRREHPRASDGRSVNLAVIRQALARSGTSRW